MKGFFKKKNSQANPSSKTNYLDIPISENHPFLTSLPSYQATTIRNNPDLKNTFTKLFAWLKFHPNSSDNITLYQYSKKLNPTYHEFRQYALKSQITEGFKFILHVEATINETVEGSSIFADPPHEEISHLNNYHKLWQKAVQQDFLIQLLKFEMFEIRNEVLIQNKQTAAHLISLLASIDAIPLNFIPLIHFSHLDIPNDVIYSNNKRCVILQNLCSKYSESKQSLFQQIDDLYNKYDEVKENQIARFRLMIGQYRKNYDTEWRCLDVSVDPSIFVDFVAHSKSIVYQDVQHFYSNPTSESFNHLIEQIITSFQINNNEECSIINDLCSMSFALLALPEMKDDSPQLSQEQINVADLDELMLIGFNIFTICDPILTLKYISDNIDFEKNLEDSVKRKVNALKVFTSDWKTFLKFVVDFTKVEYLGSKLNSIRFVIQECIQA